MVNMNNFDANTVDPMIEFEPIPAGKYLAIIAESEMKSTKSGTGVYLEFTFQIIEGEYKGRNHWARLNLENPSKKAVEIARAELSSICRAAGVMQPKDSVELHDLPLVISVRYKKREDTGELTIEIKVYDIKDFLNDKSTGDTQPWENKKWFHQPRESRIPRKGMPGSPGHGSQSYWIK